MDDAHRLACTGCHGGDASDNDKTRAHTALIPRPAHPDHAAASCGKCHAEEVANLAQSRHYILDNAVNLVRRAFGATEKLPSLTAIPISREIDNITDLADDMLRRRCLRCHLFTPGDSYSATRRGTGCAACHMPFSDGKPTTHRFAASPADDRCLSCHYGNRVGFDYYGRFEHDFNVEYRTPYSAADTTDRPYGVDYHELAEDVHRQRGLICIDCHSGPQLMQTASIANTIRCNSCHDREMLVQTLPPGVVPAGNDYIFISKSGATQHLLPLMNHPAHTDYTDVDCQACHAQWSFDDVKTHLLRSDVEEYFPWARLTVQGSSEVEKLLTNNLDFDKTEMEAATTDKLSNEKRPGIWYKGYTMRRWETLPLGRDAAGKIRVMRPELNLSLSYIDSDEEVHFDSHDSIAPHNGLLPYTPHTTGRAGLIYQERLRRFLEQEQHRQ